MSFLLYVTHVLWLAFGLVWLAAWALVDEPSRHRSLARLASALPAAGVAVWWQRTTVAGSSFSSALSWGDPWQRLNPLEWGDAALGALQSSLEIIPFVVVLAWIVWALIRRRRDSHRALMLCGGLLLACYLLLPAKYTNTILFNNRWMPFAMVCLLLAVPRIDWKPLYTVALVALISGFLVLISLSWLAFDRIEMAGLTDSIEALPEQPRVLGLAYQQESRWIDGRPFIQAFAYAQVQRGGMLNFSFASFRPSLVVFRSDRPSPWTNSLEWFPRDVKAADFQFFDHVLAHGDEKTHRELQEKGSLLDVTQTLPWRLHRVGSRAGL